MTLKIAALAPMQRASVAMAAAAKPYRLLNPSFPDTSTQERLEIKGVETGRGVRGGFLKKLLD